MRMKIVAASLLALGMATSAFAQSNPAPTGATMDKNTVDTGGGAGVKAKKPMATDKMKTGSTKKMTSTKTHKLRCPDHASSSGTGRGKLQTQGGTSNATPMDEACAAHNN
ncbi:hypothetical protein FHX08_001218 [Rhizobium sp. BK529]|uniref:hypothetical protein n=1 Tax=unclassified Rhizobium TaxID=2613769 RepID=UPI001051F8AB|nr:MULTISPECIES: hypothetical protein [unclassified Rhizobium]MBB3590874.1 hypothetical protein [Rhizobium sp. BK529]TCS09171.1 hypothetical protein EV281_1011052 [Rhizobium sp. BK418]